MSTQRAIEKRIASERALFCAVRGEAWHHSVSTLTSRAGPLQSADGLTGGGQGPRYDNCSFSQRRSEVRRRSYKGLWRGAMRVTVLLTRGAGRIGRASTQLITIGVT